MNILDIEAIGVEIFFITQSLRIPTGTYMSHIPQPIIDSITNRALFSHFVHFSGCCVVDLITVRLKCSSICSTNTFESNDIRFTCHYVYWLGFLPLASRSFVLVLICINTYHGSFSTSDSACRPQPILGYTVTFSISSVNFHHCLFL